jgi:hypothetical protein
MHNKRKILEILNGVVFAVTIIGANILRLVKVEVSGWNQLILTVVFAAFYFYFAYEKTKTGTFVLEEKSIKFTDFFVKWYSQDGNLSIFCSDLDWLNNKESAGIVYQLSQKKKDLNLYLRKLNGPVVKQLKDSGANVMKIKKSIQTVHRLSLLKSDDSKKMIIRNTDIESKKITFIERDNISDPYLIGLAEDVLDDCYEKGKKNGNKRSKSRK